MNTSALLLLLTLYPGALAAQEGGCGRAGALRCDADGRHVSACTRGGAWRPVLDCAASNAACVDGRCVASSSTRTKTCSTPGQTSCSSDCTHKTVCTSNNVWVEVSRCPSEYICDCGECVDKSTNYCRYSNTAICGSGSKNHYFPDVDNCSRQYVCTKEGDSPGVVVKCINDPNVFYQPCTGECVSTSTFCDRYESCDGNEGMDAVVFGNPTLHYICANGFMFLMKCISPKSTYDPISGECIEIGQQYCPTVRMGVNSFSKFFTPDDCENTGGSTTISLPCRVGDKWPDPTSECKYYYCYPLTGEPINMTCPPNSKYNSSDKSCVTSSGSCLR